MPVSVLPAWPSPAMLFLPCLPPWLHTDGSDREVYQEYGPLVLAQQRHLKYREFETFDAGLSEFYSKASLHVIDGDSARV